MTRRTGPLPAQRGKSRLIPVLLVLLPAAFLAGLALNLL